MSTVTLPPWASRSKSSSKRAALQSCSRQAEQVKRRRFARAQAMFSLEAAAELRAMVERTI